MGFYKSEKEAAYFALRELERYVPAEWTDGGIEWGTVIYRAVDSAGGYRYTFINPEEGKVREYEPPPPPLSTSGWTEIAIVHTHPNDTGFSGNDKTITLFRKCTMYMVTQSGAYWYEGKADFDGYGRNSLARFGTMWGDQYPWALDDPTVKRNQG